MQQLLSRVTDFTEIVLVDFEFTSTPRRSTGSGVPSRARAAQRPHYPVMA